jgi:hypothetical protein
MFDHLPVPLLQQVQQQGDEEKDGPSISEICEHRISRNAQSRVSDHVA